MPNFTADPILLPSQVFSSTATATYPLGTRAVTRDGRVFRYCFADPGNALVVGNVIQGAAQITNHQGLTPVANNIGDTVVTMALGATAVTANQYAQGLLIVTVTPGIGYAYPISGHPAALASANLTVTLPKDSAIQVALTTSSRVSLEANPYAGVLQAPATTLTRAVVGVAVYPIAAGQYGWVQTHGPGGVLMPAASAPAVGALIGSPSATAGAVTTQTAGMQLVGTMSVTGTINQVNAAFLTIE